MDIESGDPNETGDHDEDDSHLSERDRQIREVYLEQTEDAEAQMEEMRDAYGAQMGDNQDHHRLPQNKAFKEYCGQLGIEVDDLCNQIDKDRHLTEIHKPGPGLGDPYNQPWNDLMKGHPITPETSEPQRQTIRELMFAQYQAQSKEFGLEDNETYQFHKRDKLTDPREVFKIPEKPEPVETSIPKVNQSASPESFTPSSGDTGASGTSSFDSSSNASGSASSEDSGGAADTGSSSTPPGSSGGSSSAGGPA